MAADVRPYGDITERFELDEETLVWVDAPYAGWARRRETGQWYAFDCRELSRGLVWHWRMVAVDGIGDDPHAAIARAAASSSPWTSVLEDARSGTRLHHEAACTGPLHALNDWCAGLELHVCGPPSTTIVGPSWADVERELARLDADKVSELSVGPLDGSESLGIGGGNGQYVLFIGYDDHNEFWNLEVPEHGDSVVELTAGGQAGDFRAYQVVSLELARAGLLAYYESGARAPGLPWRKQR